MLKVWTDNQQAGLLDRNRGGMGLGASFAYLPDADDARAVSLTMPKRLQSYEQDYGLHPIFEMNLPEGALRERLRLTFAKAAGRFDDLDLLSIVGRSQMGRIRYTAREAHLDDGVPFQSVDEILESRRAGSLMNHLLQRFASYSGISGVQPKVLIRDEVDLDALHGSPTRLALTFQGATHIIKFWHAQDFPQLAANEYFCMQAAAKAGLPVPRVRLSEGGDALVVDRFDLNPDGTYRGIEDFCVLNGLGTAKKYYGGYERGLFKKLKDNLLDPVIWRLDAGHLFKLFVLNCAIRNGDAHLKNFALIYDTLADGPRLAPAYDLVTTRAYIADDRMALTLGGKPLWPDAKQLDNLGTTRCLLSPADAKVIRETVAEALSSTLKDMAVYAREHPAFSDVFAAMKFHWQDGMKLSAGCTPGA